MLWLEMSRNVEHGGPGWEFGTCLWSPTERDGGGKWGYWDLMQRIRKDDVILHLRGKTNQRFIGHSIADTDCYVTTDRPSQPGAWSHARSFYRVPLRDYCSLDTPVVLAHVFERNRDKLIEYHSNHSPAHRKDGRYLFFVPQSSRLQCQNGAYLSEVDSDLARILFGSEIDQVASESPLSNVNTDVGFSVFRTRIGQTEFSAAVRENYRHECCFPDCGIHERNLLVGAHIARWSDAPKLRGLVENGLCLCLMHDKAFELGWFTLDDSMRVLPNVKNARAIPWVMENILPFAGRSIATAHITPSLESIHHHWSRIDFSPSSSETE